MELYSCMVYGIETSSKAQWIEWLSVEAYIYVCANDPPIFGYFHTFHYAGIRCECECRWHPKYPCENHSLLLCFIIVVVVVCSARSYFIADCLHEFLPFLSHSRALFCCSQVPWKKSILSKANKTKIMDTRRTPGEKKNMWETTITSFDGNHRKSH